jgi:hypothetical protein
MTPERMAALEAAAADSTAADAALQSAIAPERERLDEAVSPVAGRRFTRA